jgi:hypothetical protein
VETQKNVPPSENQNQQNKKSSLKARKSKNITGQLAINSFMSSATSARETPSKERNVKITERSPPTPIDGTQKKPKHSK